MMNIVDTRQGDGTYVTSLEPDLLVEPLDFIISFDDSALHHLFEARRILEVGIASLAAERITDEQIIALQDHVHASGQAAADPEAFRGVDLAIHELIVDAAANPLLRRIMSSLSRLGRASRNRTAAMPEVRQRTVEDHRAIVAALEKRDPERAAEAMTDHLDNIESSLD